MASLAQEEGPGLIVGALVPSAYLAPAYAVNDYSAYGFPPPPPQDRWIRYRRDMLLVRQDDRRIIQVARNIFPVALVGPATALVPVSALGFADPEELPGDPLPLGVLQ